MFFKAKFCPIKSTITINGTEQLSVDSGKIECPSTQCFNSVVVSFVTIRFKLLNV